MAILRRYNLLKAFLADDKRETHDGEKVLKAFSTMVEKKK
jgi:hypothetical protein